ncbi:hypothetical protein E2C01_078244 [Portunus trituberculatus]|nr:hypothetical protein [Portunus trituberculatus]
MPRAPR